MIYVLIHYTKTSPNDYIIIRGFCQILIFNYILSYAPILDKDFNTRFIDASTCSSVRVPSAERITIE